MLPGAMAPRSRARFPNTHIHHGVAVVVRPDGKGMLFGQEIIECAPAQRNTGELVDGLGGGLHRPQDAAAKVAQRLSEVPAADGNVWRRTS